MNSLDVLNNTESLDLDGYSNSTGSVSYSECMKMADTLPTSQSRNTARIECQKLPKETEGQSTTNSQDRTSSTNQTDDKTKTVVEDENKFPTWAKATILIGSLAVVGTLIYFAVRKK